MVFRRPLIPCIVAYISGLWLVHDMYHAWPLAAMVIGGIIMVGAGALAIWGRDMTPLYLILVMGMGAAVMGVREQRHKAALDVVGLLQGPGVHVISGRVHAIAELSDTERKRLVLDNIEITSGVKTLAMPGLMQMIIDDDAVAEGAAPVVGEHVAFPGHIYRPSALSNFFGYDRLAALRHEGIFASARPLDLQGIVRIVPDSGGLYGTIERALTTFRRKVSDNLRRDMWEREGRLMVAMLFNDMRELTNDEKDIFRKSQTFHLFAVSGMHVAILGLVLNLIFRAMRFGVRGSWIGVAIVLFLYLWIIGFVPSATRSYLMLVAFTAGYMLGREVNGITALVLAVAAVVIYDPAAPWKAGFILSVVGVGAIVLFTPLLKLWMPWSGKSDSQIPLWMTTKVSDIVLAGAAVGIFLIPLQVYYFGYWNLVSPVANLVQAVLAEFVLSAGVLVAFIGLISEQASHVLGQSASLLMHVIFLISKVAADADWAIFYFRQMPLSLMLICYGIIMSGYYLTHRDSPEFRLKSRARFAAHTFCAFGVLLAGQAWTDFNRPEMEIWSMDVGQGDATLIRFPNGQTMLIDAGEFDPDMGKYVVVPQIRGMGISKLDYIVATHDDEDHTGGLASVIQAVGCDYLLVPAGMEAKSESTREMLDAAEKTHCVVRNVSSGFSANAGGCLIEILNPLSAPSADQSDNEMSIVVRVSYGRFVALLMGDAGLAVEARLINNRMLAGATVLKVGHHGSKSSTGKELLAAVRPACALVSCGVRNNFGHPAKEVMQRLRAVGTRILRTDTDGAVRIETDGKMMEIETAR